VNWNCKVRIIQCTYELLSYDDILSYQVSDAVGSTKNNSPRLIVSIDSQKNSISHFLKRSDPKKEAVIKNKKRKIEKESN
jgi:hypothetical protein